MKIKPNTVVSLNYTLHQDDEKGEMIESTVGNNPLVFLFGAGQMIPDFEKNLDGLSAGSNYAFQIGYENAYGDFNPEAVVNLPKEIFVIDGELAEDLLEIGNTVPMRGQDGNLMHAVVKSVQSDSVTMDFNHPMAGKNLYFHGEILSVREATQTELDHGHVHGEGGVHH